MAAIFILFKRRRGLHVQAKQTRGARSTRRYVFCCWLFPSSSSSTAIPAVPAVLPSLRASTAAGTAGDVLPAAATPTATAALPRQRTPSRTPSSTRPRRSWCPRRRLEGRETISRAQLRQLQQRIQDRRNVPSSHKTTRQGQFLKLLKIIVFGFNSVINVT